MKNKKAAAILVIIVILSMTFGVVFAGSINAAVASVVGRFTSTLDSTGSSVADNSQQEMGYSAIEARQRIDNILASTNNEIRTQLEQYKNSEIQKRNQEIDTLVNDIQTSVNEKKVQKLDEYKLKIDQSIDKEYNKLLKDLIEGK